MCIHIYDFRSSRGLSVPRSPRVPHFREIGLPVVRIRSNPRFQEHVRPPEIWKENFDFGCIMANPIHDSLRDRLFPRIRAIQFRVDTVFRITASKVDQRKEMDFIGVDSLGSFAARRHKVFNSLRFIRFGIDCSDLLFRHEFDNPFRCSCFSVNHSGLCRNLPCSTNVRFPVRSAACFSIERQKFSQNVLLRRISFSSDGYFGDKIFVRGVVMYSSSLGNRNVEEFVIALGNFEGNEMENCEDVVLLYAIQQSCEVLAAKANQRLQSLCLVKGQFTRNGR